MNVLGHLSPKMKIKAILLQVYHHAIHNRYQDARHLLMKSQIQNVIAKQQILNQIYYNRAIVQLGFCAFRQGHFDDANTILAEVAQNTKIRESLAQGVTYTRNQDKSVEDEMEEKKRFVPPHLQINLEQLESTYLTTSMMIEVPSISENRYDIQNNTVSRSYRKLCEIYENKGIHFAAQNSRDFIMKASQHLHRSEWEEALNSICQIKQFSKLAEFKDGSLKEHLANKLKEIGLKIYLIDSQFQYNSYSLENLQSQFDMNQVTLVKNVSKLIAHGTISASIDFKNKSITRQGNNTSEQKREIEHL